MEERIIEPIFRGNYFKQVKVGRLPTGSHQTAEPTVMGFYSMSKKSEIEESIKNERKQEKICLLDETFNG